jgi:hypothetical protein
MTPGAFLAALTQQQLLPDAVRFLAALLPKRTAVAWACRCVRSIFPELAPPAAAAVKAAENWSGNPSEPNRRAAEKAANDAGMDSAPGLCAAAAFFSEGSMGPANVAPIPPADHISARLVAGALLMAAVASEPDKMLEKLSTFIGWGREKIGTT